MSVLPTDSSLRRRAPDERPSQIVEAALEVFGERGLAGARLEDIAKRAGIAKGTIYLYFPNKEDLFREVVRLTIVARLDEAERELGRRQHESATEALRFFVHGWWEFANTAAFQTVYRLVVGELHRFPDVAEFYAREVIPRAHGIVGAVLARGIERGEFRPIDTLAATRMISTLITSQALWAAKKYAHALGAPVSSDALCEQILDFVLHALRPPAGSTPDAAAGAFTR